MRQTALYYDENGEELTSANPLPIYSITPFTMLDFPKHVACIIWFSGCNMRCAYCHNPQIVKGKTHIKPSKILSFLQQRQGLLDGVVLSGGEATLYKALPEFAQTVRGMKYKIKLDTNGTNPRLLKELLDKNLLDYVALDYKAPAQKFASLTKMKRMTSFETSLSMLTRQTSVPVEIRTTVHTDLLNEDDIGMMIETLDRLDYTGTYFIQNFRNDNRPTLGHLPAQTKSLNIDKLPTPQNFQIEYRNF